jgi:hypothetical protein
MSATWDYAQHSKAVSLKGGPELFVRAIKLGAFVRGSAVGVAVGAAVGSAVTYGVGKYRQIQERAREAEQALLEGPDGP